MSPMLKQPLTIEHALLGFLQKEPLHAYEIHQVLMRPEALGLVWHLKQSLVYVMLDRLAEAGYLTISLEYQGPRPPRKLLQLTPQGHVAFAEWLVAPVAHGRDLRLEFLAKLYFAQQAGAATISTLIDQQRTACQTWLQELQAQAAAIPNSHTFDWLVLQFRIGQLDAIVRWLDTCATSLSAKF